MTVFELANIPRSRDLFHTYLICTIREVMLLEDDIVELYVPNDSPYLSIELFYPLRDVIFEEIRNGNITNPSLYLKRTSNTLFLIKVR